MRHLSNHLSFFGYIKYVALFLPSDLCPKAEFSGGSAHCRIRALQLHWPQLSQWPRKPMVPRQHSIPKDCDHGAGQCRALSDIRSHKHGRRFGLKLSRPGWWHRVGRPVDLTLRALLIEQPAGQELSQGVFICPIYESSSLERLCDLATLTQPRLGVLVLLPRDGVHGIAGLADSHDHTELIARRGQVVVCLVTQGYLYHVPSAYAHFIQSVPPSGVPKQLFGCKE